jgi:NADPH-dependent 2,4-dienoyl-CoA reductase/sulfur reductase-like enzyme
MKFLNYFVVIFAFFYFYYRFFFTPKTMTQQNKTVIVVGGGLAGLSAAIEAHDQGNTRVILIEKEDKIG